MWACDKVKNILAVDMWACDKVRTYSL